MSTKKKIIITILLGLLVALGIYLLVLFIKQIIDAIDTLINYDVPSREYIIKFLVQDCLVVVFIISTFAIISMSLICMWKGKLENIKHDIRYTYEDYKQRKIQKQKNKVENKIKKLEAKQRKLQDEIENQ